MSAGANPLDGFTVDRAAIRYVGRDLQRPECILAEPDGTLWAADARGGVMRIDPDGTQMLVAQQSNARFGATGDFEARFTQGTLPNGLAFAANGDFLIANFGTDALEVMTRDGRSRTLHDTIDGKPIGKVNFVLRDSRDRLWLTISTRINPWTAAIKPGITDGYVALADGRGLRVVAEGFAFTNEVRMDANEEWLYIVETTGKRISRMRVGADGSLRDREVFGPEPLGEGFPDGIAFDAYGNLWCTMVMADRLIAITPQGDVRVLLDDCNVAATAALEAKFARGEATTEDMQRAKGTIAPWMASVTFGGRDLRTAYIGSLVGTRIPCFTSPVPGLPMVHWRPR
ncbi:MAG: SMP-30/gluconolactonase/LRE family protein [Burkholderiales bacterium]|nr:SMP-30/gluconolactonase/LRE family protein [Burkholderiales bacterium]